jgi:hypothetical protein
VGHRTLVKAVAGRPASKWQSEQETARRAYWMTNALPGRPFKDSAQRSAESYYTYLLLILGIALIGAGIAVLGFASGSLAAVGIGAGFLIADGMITLFVAVVTRSSTTLAQTQMTRDLNHSLKLDEPAAPNKGAASTAR